jgi:hypothetical protein
MRSDFEIDDYCSSYMSKWLSRPYGGSDSAILCHRDRSNYRAGRRNSVYRIRTYVSDQLSEE